MFSALSEFLHVLSVRLEHVPSWAIFLGGGVIAAPAIATPMGDGLDFKSIVHGLGVVIGTIGLLWPAVRTMIRKSDTRTAQKVDESQAQIVSQLSERFDSFEQAQADRNKALASLGPRLVSIDTTMRDVGDVRSDLTGMAFQVGELATDVKTLKNGMDALHHWKRQHDEHHRKGDELLKQWAEELKRRRLSDPNLTPPTGWDPNDEGGKPA